MAKASKKSPEGHHMTGRLTRTTISERAPAGWVEQRSLRRTSRTSSVAVVGYAVTAIQEAVGDNDRIHRLATRWRDRAAFLLAQDIREGVPRHDHPPEITDTGLSI